MLPLLIAVALVALLVAGVVVWLARRTRVTLTLAAHCFEPGDVITTDLPGMDQRMKVTNANAHQLTVRRVLIPSWLRPKA